MLTTHSYESPVDKRRRHSGTPSAVVRRARVLERGIAELQTALEEGALSLYRAGEICRLPPEAQPTAIELWTNRTHQKQVGSALAARVLKNQLQKYPDQKLDLAEIGSLIREAIVSTGKGTACF